MAVYATWNPSDKGANISLSNGNLTATKTAGGATWQTVRSTISKTSGKWYWEYTYTTSDGDIFTGFANSSSNLNDLIGDDAFGIGYYAKTGEKFINALNTAYGATYTAGDKIGVALDVDASTVTYYKNGASQGAISFSISAPLFAGYSQANTVNLTTVNFGASAFTFSPPAGYNPGLYNDGALSLLGAGS